MIDKHGAPRLPRIGVDVDGVLAQFNKPYAALLEELGVPTGTFPIEDPLFPPCWDWDILYMEKAGWSPEAIKAKIDVAWAAIRKSTAFWATLPSYPTTHLDIINLRTVVENAWDVYFITCRPGMTAKFQTEAWLMSKGLKAPFIPTVLIVENGEVNKSRLCKALELDAIIDDKPSNLQNVRPPTTKYLLDRPFNREWYELGGHEQCHRVKSVTEMLEKLLKEIA
jgi:5'(3')-deoxyribonucleotidase